VLREQLSDNAMAAVPVHVVRKKLESDPTQPKHLLTETGIGYRFVP
jgi:DNA-binding response OmpR family regulator